MRSRIPQNFSERLDRTDELRTNATPSKRWWRRLGYSGILSRYFCSVKTQQLIQGRLQRGSEQRDPATNHHWQVTREGALLQNLCQFVSHSFGFHEVIEYLYFKYKYTDAKAFTDFVNSAEVIQCMLCAFKIQFGRYLFLNSPLMMMSS